MAEQELEGGPGGVPEREELLSTKVAIPRIRPELLTRSPLLEALDQATVHGLTLVCTQPGFGKTTLLAQWAQIARGRVAWLSLDPDDSDPVRFWRYLVAALDHAGLLTGGRVKPLLQAPSGVSSETIVAVLINDLETHPEETTPGLEDTTHISTP